MLKWSIIFLVIALISGLLGFTSITGASIQFAKILFYLFVVIFVVSLIFGRRNV